MRVNGLPLPCYLVEWYQPELTADRLNRTAERIDACTVSVSADGMPVQLLLSVAVPADDVIVGIFAASSEDCVMEACRRAGIPAQRLTFAAIANGSSR